MKVRSHLLPALALMTLGLISATSAFLARDPRPDSSSFPSTDIVLCTLRDSAGFISLEGEPIRVTNRTGYDNQPSFLFSGKKILYASIRDDTQSDIFLYDLDSSLTMQVTTTPESEYSPQQIEYGGRFSVVRVEADSSQRLWAFPFDTGAPMLISKTLIDIAYYSWIENSAIAVIQLQKKFNSTVLRLTDTYHNFNSVIGSNTGRCIAKVPGNPGLSFLQKLPDTSWICVHDLEALRTIQLVPVLPGSEDFAWGPRRTLFMGNGSKLFYCRPPSEKAWKEIADLSKFGFRDITRLAVNRKGDKIAIVVADGVNPK